jgi:lambda family phage portal protein
MQGTVTGANKRTVRELQGAWDAWAGARTCDQRGKQTFGGLQRLVARTLLESGEVLARRVWDRDAPFGLRVQVLEPDYLDHALAAVDTRRDLADGHRLVAGIELDAADRPVAYWLLPHHPGNTWSYGTLGTPERVAAGDVAHVYDEERPGQVRGVPLLSAALIRLRDLDEYEDAQLVRQKVAACFAAFYSQPEGATGSKDGALCDHVEPGMIEELPPGYEVTFASPPGVQGYDDVMTRGLQAVGAATGVPYEEISGDYSKVNFSSARMARAAFHALVDEYQWQVIIPGFCDRVFAWFLDAARIQGHETAHVRMEWTTPRKILVDPAREIPAAIQGVRATLMSPQEVMRELGYDPEQVLREWQAFATLVDELELVSDIDPRRTTGQGSRVPPPSPPPETEPDKPSGVAGAPGMNGHAPS